MAKSFYFPKANKDWKITLHYFDDTNEWGRTLTYEIGGNDRYFFAALPNYVKRSLASEEVSIDLKKLENLFDGIAQQVVDAFCYQFEILRVIKLDSLPGEIQEEIRRAVCLTIEHLLRNGLFQKVNDNSITTQSFTINQSAVGWINSADFTGTVAWKVLMNVLSRFKIKDKAIYYEDQLIDYKAVIDGKLEFLIKPIVEALKKDKEFEEQIAKIPHVRPFGKIRVDTRLTKDPYTSKEIIVEDIDKPLNWHITGNHTAKWDKEHNELSVEVNDGEDAFKELTWEEQDDHIDANGKEWKKGDIRSVKVGHLNKLNFRGTHHSHINLDDPGNTDKPELTIKVDDGLPFTERVILIDENEDGKVNYKSIPNHLNSLTFSTNRKESGYVKLEEISTNKVKSLDIDFTQIRSGKDAFKQIEFWDEEGQHKTHPIGYYDSLQFKTQTTSDERSRVVVKEDENKLLIDFSNIHSGKKGDPGVNAFKYLHVNEELIEPKAPIGLNIQSPGASIEHFDGFVEAKIKLRDGKDGQDGTDGIDGKDGINAFSEVKVNDVELHPKTPLKLHIESKGAQLEKGDTIKLKVEDGKTLAKKIQLWRGEIEGGSWRLYKEVETENFPIWKLKIGGKENNVVVDEETGEIDLTIGNGISPFQKITYLENGEIKEIELADEYEWRNFDSLNFRGTAKQIIKEHPWDGLTLEINDGLNAFQKVKIGDGEIHNQRFEGLWLTGNSGTKASYFPEDGINWLKLDINNGRDGTAEDFIAGRHQILPLVYDYREEKDDKGFPTGKWKDWPDKKPAPFHYDDIPHKEGDEEGTLEELVVNTNIDFKTNHFHLGTTKIDENWILARRDEIQELQSTKQDRIIQNFGDKYQWIPKEDISFENANVVSKQTPTNDNHLANKKYVDDNITSTTSKIDYTFRQGKYALETYLDMRKQNIENINVLSFNGSVAMYSDNKHNYNFNEGVVKGFKRILNLEAPKDNGDATNKEYVDKEITSLQGKTYTKKQINGFLTKKANKGEVYKKNEVDDKLKNITIDTSKFQEKFFELSRGKQELNYIGNVPIGFNHVRLSEIRKPEADDEAVNLAYLNSKIAEINKEIGLKQNTHFHIDGSHNTTLRLDKDITHLDFGKTILTYGDGGNETDTERRIANHKFVKNEIKFNKVFGLHTIGGTKHIIIDRDDIADTDFVLSLKDKSSRGNHITIRDVPKPKEGSDIANKEYVDEHLKDYVELTQFNIVKEDVKTNKNNISSLQTNKQDKMFKKNGNEWLYERSENINFNYKTITGIPKIPSYGSSPISKDYFEGIIQGLKNPYLEWDNSGLTYTGTNAFKFNNQRLSNVADPSYSQDAATKWYVDNEISNLRREIQATNSRYNQAIRERDRYKSMAINYNNISKLKSFWGSCGETYYFEDAISPTWNTWQQISRAYAAWKEPSHSWKLDLGRATAAAWNALSRRFGRYWGHPKQYYQDVFNIIHGKPDYELENYDYLVPLYEESYGKWPDNRPDKVCDYY